MSSFGNRMRELIAHRNIKVDKLETYQYSPLQNPARDIRLMELLPSRRGSPIRVKIIHTAIERPVRPVALRMTVQEVQETLPAHWSVYETLNGRYIFLYKFRHPEQTSHWTHPDPNIDHWRYKEAPVHAPEPNYEAVSYVWGSSIKSKKIVVDSTEGAETKSSSLVKDIQAPQELSVSNNLFEALQYLRRVSHSRLLWFDAISINQADDVEKAQQVRRMAEIYQQAHRVVVWLGTESNRSSLALEFLQELSSRCVCEVTSSQYAFTPPELNGVKKLYTWPKGRAARDKWEALRAFLDRSWFHRIWTIQEVQLSRRQPDAIFYCGSKTITRSQLLQAIAYLQFEPDNVAFSVTTKLSAPESAILPISDRPLHDILVEYATSKHCADDRDRIYGLLGISPKAFASRIMPDYQATNTPAHVYQAVVLAHASQVQRLELLDFCSPMVKYPEAPSWVPDWSIERQVRTQIFSSVATTTSRANFHHDETAPDIIRIMGIKCAVVQDVSLPLGTKATYLDAVEHIKHWQPDNLDSVVYEPTGENLRTAFALTLCCNATKERWGSTNATQFPPISEWILQDYENGLFSTELNRTRPMRSLFVPDFVQGAVDYCKGRVFARLSDRYIGLMPCDTQQGDIIAVFLGADNPQVLRPTLSDQSFILIGECFVYGLHDGIKLLGALPKPWKVQFVLGAGRRLTHRFINEDTGEHTLEDPRLTPLKAWKRCVKKVDGDDPIHYDFFQHLESGEVINYDPRLDPDELRIRGVELTTFSLI